MLLVQWKRYSGLKWFLGHPFHGGVVLGNFNEVKILSGDSVNVML